MDNMSKVKPLLSQDLKGEIKKKADESSAQDQYTLLVTKAPYIRGNLSDLVPIEDLPWFDKSLVNHGIRFYASNLTLIILSNAFALMFGFCVKPNSAVILRTGKLYDPELSFQRYLSTVQRIGKFLMLSFSRKKAYKALDTVRKMHNLASKRGKEFNPTPEKLKLDENWKRDLAEAMRKDLGHIDTSSAPKEILTWDPPVPISTFDMVMTQWGIIGTMWLFPKVFGIKDREEELKGVLHLWAIFGRLLGIQDEYNVCIKPNPVLYDMLFRNIVVESLKTMDETVISIQSAFMSAFSKRVPIMTYKAMLLYGLQEVEGYKGEHLWKLMGWTDKLSPMAPVSILASLVYFIMGLIVFFNKKLVKK